MSISKDREILAALLARRGLLPPQNALSRPREPTRNALYGGFLGPPPEQPAPPSAIGGLFGMFSRAPQAEEVLPLPSRDAYDTKLDPLEEFKYRAWMLSIGHTPQNGFAVDNNFTGENYDYRGYFKKYGPVKLGEQDHLTDEFKLPMHPSFSDESIYAKPGTPGAPYAGSWQGEHYTPSLLRSLAPPRKK